MQKSDPKSLKVVNKNVREISFLLDTIGCKLRRTSEIKYEVMAGRESTGLVIIFGKDIINNQNCNYILAIMYFPIPDKDNRFFIDQGQNTEDFPHVMAVSNNKNAKALLYEFIFRSVYFFKSSKIYRKWNCYNCGQTGYELFLDDGSVGTFDANCDEFRLIIVDKSVDVEGIVFDDLIDEYVLPVCDHCKNKLDYNFEEDSGLVVDKMYFQRLLSKRPQNARVMGVA